MKPFVPHRDERRQLDDGVAPKVCPNTPHIVVRSLANPISYMPLALCPEYLDESVTSPAPSTTGLALPPSRMRSPHSSHSPSRRTVCTRSRMQRRSHAVSRNVRVGNGMVCRWLSRECKFCAIQSRSHAVNRDDKATIYTSFAESRP
jgi:hypothetical protein